MNAKRTRASAGELFPEEAPGIGEPGWWPTEVHPLAARFPTMAPDDMAALAGDIKENGLLHNPVIDDEGMLIDGRMRLAACKLAGVVPTYTRLNGTDPVRLIWSANGHRRQMTKGQKAMIAAMDLLLETNGKPSNADRGITLAAKAAGVSQSRVSQALLVRKHAADLVAQVTEGSMGLDAALVRAEASKKALEWHVNGMAMLRKQDPELAQRVADEELTLDQARQTLVDRSKAEESSRDAILLSLSSMTKMAITLAGSETVKRLPDWMRTEAGAEHQARYFKGGSPEVLDQIRAAREGLNALEQLYETMTKGDE